MRLGGPWLPGFSLLSLLKKGRIFSLFHSAGTSPDCQDFTNTMESGLTSTSANSLRSLGCTLLGPHWYKLMYIQVPQVVMNQIFTYCGRHFGPPAPILLSIHSRDVKTELAIENREKKSVEYLISPLIHCYQFCLSGDVKVL